MILTDQELNADLDRRIARWDGDHLFEVYASHGGPFRGSLPERVIGRHLTWTAARDLAAKLQKRYNNSHPNRSHWTQRFYSARRSYLLP